MTDAPYNKGKGAAYLWILANVGYIGNECLIWPFSKTYEGYGQFGLDGDTYLSHRFICKLAHGEPPTEDHEAAHSCNNASCMNIDHLSWKTSQENSDDQSRAGTNQGNKWGWRGSLTETQRAEILSSTETNIALAAKFGVSKHTIGRFKNGKSYQKPPIDWIAVNRATAEKRKAKA